MDATKPRKKRCRNTACSWNKRGYCDLLPGSAAFTCKQANREVVDIGI